MNAPELSVGGSSTMSEDKASERKSRREQRRSERLRKKDEGAEVKVKAKASKGRRASRASKAAPAAKPPGDEGARSAEEALELLVREGAAASRAESPPDEAPAAAPAEASPSFTIDELAARSGVPSRTIRFYQSSGVLPKPQKRGRVAFYGPHHVERLELIGQLQDRGLRMRAIKELVEQLDEGGVVLEEWLGLEDQLSRAWIDDGAQLLSRAELDERLGPRRPGFLAELIRAGLLEPQGDDYLVNSPGLLTIAATLEEAGIHVDVTAGATAILQRHMAAAAAEVAEHFVTHAGDGFGRGKSVQAVTQAFLGLRKLGLETVRLLFAREMEQVLRARVESGEATARREGKRRRRS